METIQYPTDRPCTLKHVRGPGPRAAKFGTARLGAGQTAGVGIRIAASGTLAQIHDRTPTRAAG